MYPIQRPSQSQFVPIRTYNYHIRSWGQPRDGEPLIVMVHGWMDVGASFQFVVDALQNTALKDCHIIAPDWRGYGLTHLLGNPNKNCLGDNTDNYWIADYMADLDALIDHFSPDQPIDLIGHSLGGNVVMGYAGARPERIRKLINLEGFGMPETKPTQAPKRYADWMNQIRGHHAGETAIRPYESAAGVASRLMKTNRRLAQDKADWLAQHWSAPNVEGKHQILGDAAHKIINAQLFRLEEQLALYENITCPVLAVEASDDSMTGWYKERYTLAQYHERLKHVKDCTVQIIEDAGHMLHHDQPEALAKSVANFLTQIFH